jgi:peptidoglycan/LPS O-acetylase OafA/YrhL
LALLLLIAYGPASIINGDQQARLGPLDLYGKSTLAPLCRCLASFTLGLLAFRWHHIVRPSCTTLVAGLLLLAMTFPGTDVLLVLLFTVLVMGLYDDVGFTARLLGSRIIHTTGVWSYSIYLLHPRFNPVKQFLMRTLTNHHLPPAIAVSAAIFLSTLSVIVCAAFTYRFIEKPARKALNSIKVCRLSQTAVLDEPGVRT